MRLCGRIWAVRRGPLVLLLSIAATLLVAPAADAKVRHYWIGAVPVNWNVIPSGRDPITGQTFDPADTRMQTVVYKRFTRNWEKYLPNYPRAGDNDGIPGPLIKARVGDTVFVHFKNMDTLRNQRHSMHFHGFKYQFPSDGAYIPGESGPGANVAVGRGFVYRLEAKRGSAGVWPYHDHSSSMTTSIDGGMYGALSILRRDQKEPDRENVVFLSTHLGFMTINGRAFVGNTPTFHAKPGNVVQWDVLAIGSEHHTFHLHGHRWNWNGTSIDTRTIGPAESFRFRIKEDVPGTWFYHCHVETHMMLGMQGFYRVRVR